MRDTAGYDFFARGPLEAPFDATDAVVDVPPHPTGLDHLRANGIESQGPEIRRGSQAVQALNEFQRPANSFELACWLAVLLIIPLGKFVIA
jgi:hypothetical protein